MHYMVFYQSPQQPCELDPIPILQMGEPKLRRVRATHTSKWQSPVNLTGSLSPRHHIALLC